MAQSAEAQDFTPRQNDVLETALALLVEGGERALTTAAIARAANCSKESLYRWFGDRDGLLAAVITFQASKVRTDATGISPLTPASFRESLTIFSVDLLSVLSGPSSLALNRLAIGQASREGSPFGRLMLERGRKIIGTRAATLLEHGRQHRYLAYEDTETTYQTLYGLIVRDVHVRLLLGETINARRTDLKKQAEAAIDQFYRLYGADNQTVNTTSKETG
ncbi:MAG: TetR/AcrR family transcriptional regulator [Stappiaceae bacterium]